MTVLFIFFRSRLLLPLLILHHEIYSFNITSYPGSIYRIVEYIPLFNIIIPLIFLVLIREKMKMPVLMAFILLIYGLILSAIYTNEFPRVISDIKYILTPITFYLLGQRLKFSLNYLLSILFVDLCLSYVLGFFGYYDFFADTKIWYITSNRNIIPLLVIPAIASTSVKNNIKFGYILMSLLVVSIALSRTTLVFMFFQFLIFVFSRNWNLKAIIGLSSIILIAAYSLDWTYFIWKINSFAIGEGKSTSSLARYFEWINLIEELKKHPFGKGLGGFYSDTYYPFMSQLIGKDAYTFEDIVNRVIYKPHNQIMVMLLKFGYLGSFFVGLNVVRLYFTRKIQGIVLFTACFILLKSFSQQLLILSGLYFATINFDKAFQSKS